MEVCCSFQGWRLAPAAVAEAARATTPYVPEVGTSRRTYLEVRRNGRNKVTWRLSPAPAAPTAKSAQHAECPHPQAGGFWTSRQLQAHGSAWLFPTFWREATAAHWFVWHGRHAWDAPDGLVHASFLPCQSLPIVSSFGRGVEGISTHIHITCEVSTLCGVLSCNPPNGIGRLPCSAMCSFLLTPSAPRTRLLLPALCSGCCSPLSGLDRVVSCIVPRVPPARGGRRYPTVVACS